MSNNAQNYVDESVINYRVWHSTDKKNDYVGLAQLDLPNIENQMQEVSGSSISGTPNIPVLGHIGDMTLGITFKSCNDKAAELLTPGEHVITAVAAVQRKNIGSQDIQVVSEKYMMTVQPKAFKAGTLKPASLQETKIDFTVTKFMAMEKGAGEKDYKTIIDVDPFNFKYTVNGVDYLKAVRDAIDWQSA